MGVPKLIYNQQDNIFHPTQLHFYREGRSENLIFYFIRSGNSESNEESHDNRIQNGSMQTTFTFEFESKTYVVRAIEFLVEP